MAADLIESLTADGFWIACARGTSAFLLLLLVVLAVRVRGLAFLRDAAPPPPGLAPRVSIVVPARDEARGIEAAVRGFADQDWPDLEVVVVDDRSDDATPAILARLADELPRLRVLTVRELPPGWLGKNHANRLGGEAATGEWLLFTDADVVLAPDAVARAVGHAERRGLDHLAVAPQVRMPGTLLPQFVLYFGLMFLLFVRPWAARNPRSRAAVGIGPFNLVRARAWRAVGGHARIRLRPDDDLRLGQVLKRAGHAQDFAVGQGLVELPWYASWRELRDGLMKGLYAGVGYRPLAVAGGVVAHLLGLALPPVSLAFADGLAWWLGVANCAAFVLVGALVARGFGTARWAGALLPAFALVGAWLMARAAWRAHRYGIEWRGRAYPLALLRANRV